MIDRGALLSDLQSLLKRLEADLLERSESAEVPEVGETLRGEYRRAQEAERTAQNYEDWRTDAITQAAAAWVLSCVFVRFLEDNRLIDPPKIAGPASGQSTSRLQQPRDEWELYLSQAAQPSERDYLLSVFDELAALPGARDLFGPHNPIRELPTWLSGDGARELLRFFQKIDANTGELIHDFTDPQWDTRFLGDLYQDLSEAARKKYALLQTPEFVEEFILDRTLEPAIEEFGLVVSGPWSAASGKEGDSNSTDQGRRATDAFRMIDPACGSGHFLLGAFQRILDRWRRRDPGAPAAALVQRALDSVYGVDVNPFAVAIARFRLLLAALRAAGISSLQRGTFDFQIHLACGDSLLHGPDSTIQSSLGDWSPIHHAYAPEDLAALQQILQPGHYHAVVANPPYITPKDRQLNQAYRDRYPDVCHRQYSLAVPFMQRLFQLAVRTSPPAADQEERRQTSIAGYVGQITANSFMKREFGKKLIEHYLPQVDLTHVIDTSGAYIPGHGTPTVILLGRRRQPVSSTIRTVMGIRGEPATPDDPSQGLVWSAIVGQIDQPGSQSEFVSIGDSSREQFAKHPWSIGGGGAAELKEQLEESSARRLVDLMEDIGRTTHTGEDDAFYAPPCAMRTCGLLQNSVPLVTGEDVRDYQITPQLQSVFPYDRVTAQPIAILDERLAAHFWRYRSTLRRRRDFGQFIEERGLRWFDHSMFFPNRYRTPLSIVFAFVATHNHFVLDRGGKVFNRSAPVIKLPADATENDHLALLGLLNCSTACFWMKQVFHSKGSQGINEGLKTESWEHFREFTGTGLQQFPMAEGRPLALTKVIDDLTVQLVTVAHSAVLRDTSNVREALSKARSTWHRIRSELIDLQERLDWLCYRLYGLVDKDHSYSNGSPPKLELGQRAFEIVLARKLARGEVQTTWFERHCSTPITELPADWPDDYRQLVERRIEAIETNPNIALIEQPEYKRRWNTEPWNSQLERALREWLLDRLESYFDFDGRIGTGLAQRREGAKEESTQESLRASAPLREISLCSVARLADIARQDPQFMEVGEVYREDVAFDVTRLVEELVHAESVPLLPILRYKPSGLRKRTEWERTWELQRREDAGEDVGTIPVPPKYVTGDFINTGGVRYWALRGKLDVPKERWVSFPRCEGPDGTPIIAWAGYDHLQLARAVSAFYVDVKERYGGADDPRLVPLLGCLLELLPWLRQWHGDVDPQFNQRMDEVFEAFVNEESRELNLTLDQIRAWQPPARTSGRRRRAMT